MLSLLLLLYINLLLLRRILYLRLLKLGSFVRWKIWSLVNLTLTLINFVNRLVGLCFCLHVSSRSWRRLYATTLTRILALGSLWFDRWNDNLLIRCCCNYPVSSSWCISSLIFDINLSSLCLFYSWAKLLGTSILNFACSVMLINKHSTLILSCRVNARLLLSCVW